MNDLYIAHIFPHFLLITLPRYRTLASDSSFAPSPLSSIEVPSDVPSLHNIAMVLLSDIISRVSTLPALYTRLQQAQLLAFFDVGTRFAPFIDLTSIRPGASHADLPENIQVVLSIYTQLPVEDILALWAVLGDIILHACPGELVLLPGQTNVFLAKTGPVNQLGMLYDILHIV